MLRNITFKRVEVWFLYERVAQSGLSMSQTNKEDVKRRPATPADS